MTARSILMGLAFAALLPATTAAQRHPIPSADVVKQLRRHHHRGDWWRITTDSARYEARVSVIDAEGLAGVITARKAPPAPERIGWGSIVRIDLRKSHERREQIKWMLLGLSAGIIPLANGNANSSQPKYYMLAGALTGFLLGGRLGAADVHERPLYLAPTPLVSAAPDTAMASTPASAPPSPTLPVASAPAATAQSTSRSPATSREIERACRRISTRSLLRIQGDFGTFCGYASTIGAEGLGGLRVETARASVPSPGSLGWDRIDRLDVYGGNTGRGALGGAIATGAFAGLVGIPLGAVLSANGNDGGSGAAGIALACAGVGAGVGLVLGAAGGAISSGWHLVYRR